jgi:hypothetical protein
MDKILTVTQQVLPGHEPQMGLEAKTNCLTVEGKATPILTCQYEEDYPNEVKEYKI